MRVRASLLFSTLILAAACSDGPATVEVDPQFGKGGTAGGPPMLATEVALGQRHACALGVDRSTWCWGSNPDGQLGSGSADDSPAPVRVAGGHTFADITSGGWNHTCGLTDGGAVWCWGQNWFGQLGDGTTTNSAVPVRAAPGLTFTSVSAGTYHTCGIATDGTTYCWGSNGPLIQNGPEGWAFGTPAPGTCANLNPGYRGDPWYCSTTPVAVPGPSFVSVDAGLWATCGLTAAGEAWCTGWNWLWALGNGGLANATAMTPVAGGHTFDQLVQGVAGGCGIAAGVARCWGGRFFARGAMGNGTWDGSSTPGPVVGGLSFASIHPSDANDIYSLMCGVTTGGSAYCWGTNRFGGLGTDAALDPCPGLPDFTCSQGPVPVAGGHTWLDVATGQEFACGVTQARRVYCWGNNDAGQLGDGTLDNAFTPVPVSAPGTRGRRPASPPGHTAASLIG